MMNTNPKVCALTGATGFLGKKLHQYLSANGWRVIALTRHSPAAADDVPWSLDVQRSIARELKEREVSSLIHAAWDFTQVDASSNRRVNVDGSARLLEDCRSAGIRNALFISSISAFPGTRSRYGLAKLTVESLFLQQRGQVVRPGLIYGSATGGMFGSLRKLVKRSSIVPLIGTGDYLQYLIHQDDLAAVIEHMLESRHQFQMPLTVAYPDPLSLRAILSAIAAQEGVRRHFLPVPERLVYLVLRSFEWFGMQPGFRSDSLISLVNQDPDPQFFDTTALGVTLRGFTAS